MLRSLESAPPFFYLAVGAIGATATYLLYPSAKSPRRSRKSVLNGYPRGLINESNDCFINVIVQAIAASCKTTEWLRSNASSTAKMFDTLFKVVSMINRDGLEDIEEENEESTLTSSPSSRTSNNNSKTYIEFINLDGDQNEFNAAQILKRALKAHNWKIRTEEHDCHELFHLIMSVLEDELNDKIRSQKSLNFFQHTNLGVENSFPYLMPHNPFHGYLGIQLQCLDCDYKCPLKFESFYSISLTPPRQNPNQLFANLGGQFNPFTLYDFLRSFFNFELLSDMKCEKCNQNGNNKSKRGFIKRQAMTKLPECLCIHIQRNFWSESDYRMVKKSHFIQFPLTIKVDEYSMPSNPAFSFKQVGISSLISNNRRSRIPSQSSSSRISNSLPTLTGSVFHPSHTYELSSAIVHFGTAHSGHFVVYRKTLESSRGSPKDAWLQCSDHDIKEISLSTLLNSNAYMLFYDKRVHF